MQTSEKKIKLNKAQTDAVNSIDGPLLVLAGPGTGKTQLLSARIANILNVTDALPQNILCLTFTEAASQNMRERLASLIKDDAYDVHINTYHGFGSDIIKNYPEFFEAINLDTGEDNRLEKPIDDLTRLQIISEIVAKLPYTSPLISIRHNLKDLVSTISELKRALYTPEKLDVLAKQNLAQTKDLSPQIASCLKTVKRFPTKAEKSIELFSPILDILADYTGLAGQAYKDLSDAIEEAEQIQSSKPLTAWKNKWLTKNSDDDFCFTNESQHLKIIELANILRDYQKELKDASLYDFDDMILNTISAIKNNDDLKYNLQEKYQYILLDEFQDTNPAQFELVKLLGDNVVNEGRPNIFAVGDDDQAIYAFQGAEVSNMLDFINSFREVKIINLTENYRSHPDIIHVAHNVANQIEKRLHHSIEGIEKILIASNDNLPEDSVIERHEFEGQGNEYAWVSGKIKELIDDQKVSPDQISILAPKHAILENIVPFLAKQNIPVSYEKRENILETPLIKSYLMMAELLIAIRDNQTGLVNELFPRVLSLDFYQIPTHEIWRVNWELSRNKEQKSWPELAIQSELLAKHVEFYLSLGLKSNNEPLENVLDYLTGTAEISLSQNEVYKSSLKDYYFNSTKKDSVQYFESLANLSTIRENLRSYQQNSEELLKIDDFIKFVEAYQIAEQPLINTHPIAQSEKSVQLMTVYKAKGLEFEHVFLLSVHDDIWGKKAQSNTNKLTLPANLKSIRYRGSDEDELRRLFFVAITRAKHGLYLTSHAFKDGGSKTEPMKYLLEFKDDNGAKTTILPPAKQSVTKQAFDVQQNMKHVEILWESRHLNLDTELVNLLKNRLANYQMSPTHLNTFIDMEYGGPETFLINTLLRFPQAPGEEGEFGNAVHAVLDWYQKRVKDGNIPTKQDYIKEYEKQLSRRYITKSRMPFFAEKGKHILALYIENKNFMREICESEVDFRKEGVLIGKAHLSGKVDRLEIDKQNKTVRIVDFKTGKPSSKWSKTTKLLKYEQQLYFYKFLIEGSATYQGYRVESARLEFVEPSEDNPDKTSEPLYVNFDIKKEEQYKGLIQEVWSLIHSLKFPDVSYDASYKGCQDFIEYLLEHNHFAT